MSISNDVTVYRPLRLGGAHPAELDGRSLGGAGAALTTPRTGVDPGIGFCRPECLTWPHLARLGLPLGFSVTIMSEVRSRFSLLRQIPENGLS